MDLIPLIMKKTVEDKYFNLVCDENKCKNIYCIPCFTCARPYRYYFCEVDKIDNIEVTMLLIIDPKDKVDRRLQCVFKIHCDSIVCNDYEKIIINRTDNKLTLELDDWTFIFETVKNIVDTICFDKFQSRFTTELINDNKVVITNFLCERNKRLTKTYDTCCICWENTKRRTICCKGYICAICYSEINPRICSDCSHCVINEDCEIYGCNERPCPLCRKSMYSAIIFNDDEFT